MTPEKSLKQTLFDTIWTGASAQKFQQSIEVLRDDSKRCLYRGPNDCKCNIGQLIPDDRYDPTLEGRTAFSSDVQKAALPYLSDNERATVSSFLYDSQCAHDESGNAVEHEARLRNVAKEHGLEIPA